MIQVNDVNKVKNTPSSKIRKTSSGGDFSLYLRDIMQSPAEEGVSSASAVTGADAIFAAQTVGEEEEKKLRREQVKRGYSLLEKLEDIRAGLLRGYISKDRIIEISRFVKEQKMEAMDERLNDLIEEIELRVEVELAKLTK